MEVPGSARSSTKSLSLENCGKEAHLGKPWLVVVGHCQLIKPLCICIGFILTSFNVQLSRGTCSYLTPKMYRAKPHHHCVGRLYDAPAIYAPGHWCVRVLHQMEENGTSRVFLMVDSSSFLKRFCLEPSITSV